MTTPEAYGPESFAMEMDLPDPSTQVIESLPRAWSQGGMIEAVKRCVVTGLRDQFNNSSLNGDKDQPFYIDIEYPTDVVKYPGIWVQFSISRLARSGLAMETWTQDAEGKWGAIRQWDFSGNITLTIAALTSKDRDRLADSVVSQLAFARSEDLMLYNPTTNTNQMRGLIAALDSNPYVAMTLNTDTIASGGQTVTSGTPWAQNILLYEDSYSVSCQGTFNLRYGYDGVYTLTEIRPEPSLADTIPADQSSDPNRFPVDPRQVL